MRIFFLSPLEAKAKYQSSIDNILSIIENTGTEIVSAEKEQQYEEEFRPENIEIFGDRENVHYQFTRLGILNSDALIVESTVSNFRVGHETTLAILYRKPVLCLAQDTDYSQYIRYPGFEGAQYNDENVREIIEGFISRVREQVTAAQTSPLVIAPGRLELKKRSDHKTVAVMGHIGMDITTKVDHFPHENEAVITEGIKMALGGKATNAAVAMTRLRDRVMMIGRVGSDPLGARMKLTLELEGIDTRFVSTDSFSPTGTVLVNVNKFGKNTVVVSEEANNRLTNSPIDELTQLIDNDELTLDLFYMTLESPREIVGYAIEQMSKRNIPIFCDLAPNPRELPRELYPKIDFISPNQFEAQAITGIIVHDLATAEQAAEAIRNMGAVNNIIVTVGDQGSVILPKGSEECISFPARNTRVVDETAAGDSFRASFVTEFLTSGDIKLAMAAATRAGAFAVTQLGGYDAMPTPEQLAAFEN